MIRYNFSVFSGNTCLRMVGYCVGRYALTLRYVSGSTYCKCTAWCPLHFSIGADEQERIYSHGKNCIAADQLWLCQVSPS